ncbi:MAG: carbonic anhydrase [Bacteroidia bacterium]
MQEKDKLFLSNKAWAKEKQMIDPDYFTKLSKDQKPKYLWIGCSDSRVPANEVIGAQPGELFVHRNIANMVVHTDLNLLSVLDYAVTHLEVEHIILCGHTGCGGIKAALSQGNFDLLNKWLRNVKEVYRLHQSEINAKDTEEEQINTLVKLNVIEQVENLIKTSVIQKAWLKRKSPTIHGWIYDMPSGILQSIVEKDYTTEIDPVFKFSF